MTGRLQFGGFQHEVAAGGASVWTLQRSRSQPGRSRLVRRDQRTGRPTGSVAIAGIANAVIVSPGAVYVASVASPEGGSAGGESIVRLDPRTLRRTLVVHVP